MRWVLVIASVLLIAGAALAREQIWSEIGADCPWGSRQCKAIGGGGGGSGGGAVAPEEGGSSLWDTMVWDTDDWG